MSDPARAILDKVIGGILIALVSALLAFAAAKTNTVSVADAKQTTADIHSRIDGVESNHKTMDEKLDKLSQDVAALRAQMDILLKKIQ